MACKDMNIGLALPNYSGKQSWTSVNSFRVLIRTFPEHLWPSYVFLPDVFCELNPTASNMSDGNFEMHSALSYCQFVCRFPCWKPSVADLSRISAFLPKSEMERCLKFRFRQDCSARILNLLLVHLAWKYLQLPISTFPLHLVRSYYGKPSIKNDQCFGFNLSHSGDYCTILALKGISSGFCGVDVMKQEANVDYECLISTMARKLSPCEQDFINQSKVSDRAKNFLRIWSLKESYLKALGTGIASHTLNELSFKCETRLTKESPVFDTKLKFSIREVRDVYFTECLFNEHIFACCTKVPLPGYSSGSLQVVDAGQLIESVIPENIGAENDLLEVDFTEQFLSKDIRQD